jgi:hypothetical protein
VSAPTRLEDPTISCGLLMETAQAQQKLIGASLRQLKMHTQELDAVVRDQIRRTMVEELGAVVEEGSRAIQTLRALDRAARLRFMTWTLSLTVLSGAMTALSAWWLLPSPAEIEALRLRREQLTAALETLEQHGGLVDMRRCGSEQRWCVRVDRRAPAFGDQADYFVVKGY